MPKTSKNPQAPASKKQSFGTFLPICISAGLLGGAAAALVPGFFLQGERTLAWLFDLAIGWQLLLMALLLGYALYLLYLKRVPLALAFIAIALLPLFTASAASPSPSTPSTAPSSAKPSQELTSPLSLISANLYADNKDPHRLLQWAKEQGADVLVLHELTPEMAAQLVDNAHALGFVHKTIFPEYGNFGLGVLSKHPLVVKENPLLPMKSGGSALEVELLLSKERVMLVAAHPMPPVTASASAKRSADIKALADKVLASNGLLAGDLNATPWHPVMHEIAGKGLLRAGSSLMATWPSALPGALGLRLDHVLASPGWQVVSSEVGPDIGSDHRPVLVRLARAKLENKGRGG